MGCRCARPMPTSCSASVGSQRESHPLAQCEFHPLENVVCWFLAPIVCLVHPLSFGGAVPCCSPLFGLVLLLLNLWAKMCAIFFLQCSPLYCDNIICRKVLKRLQQAHTKLYVDIWKAFFQILFIMWQLGISVAEIEFCQAGLLVTCEWPLLLISCYFQFPSHQNGLFFPLEKSLVTSEALQYG